MSGYVFLTAFLRQRGSPESKPFEDDEIDEAPRQAQNREGIPWPVRRGGLVLTVYEHPFALTLFAIFLACFAVHAAGARRSSIRNSCLTASRRFRLVSS